MNQGNGDEMTVDNLLPSVFQLCLTSNEFCSVGNFSFCQTFDWDPYVKMFTINLKSLSI